MNHDNIIQTPKALDGIKRDTERLGFTMLRAALEPEVLEQADRLARAENKTVDELANEAVKR